MARVRVELTGTLDRVAKSDALSAQLEPFADAILAAASRDRNSTYVASLRKHRYLRPGKGGRTTWQIGAAPIIGSRVEAKRGTLQRALGEAGL